MRPNWFIGLQVPPDPWFPPLPDPPSGVRMFHPGDLHMTVAFLGGVDETAAHRAMQAITWPTGPLDVTLGPVEAFGRGTALSVTLDQGRDDVADAIAAVRDAALEAAGVRPDTREVRPHCTLARVQRKASRNQRDAAQDWRKALPTAGTPVRIDHLVLYTWSLDRRARLFRVVRRRPLRGISTEDA